jgi:hypothetical protein
MICLYRLLWQTAFSKRITKIKRRGSRIQLTFVAEGIQQMQIGLGETRVGEEEEGCEGEEEKEEGLRERRLKSQICIIFMFCIIPEFFLCFTSPNPRG